MIGDISMQFFYNIKSCVYSTVPATL